MHIWKLSLQLHLYTRSTWILIESNCVCIDIGIGWFLPISKYLFERIVSSMPTAFYIIIINSVLCTKTMSDAHGFACVAFVWLLLPLLQSTTSIRAIRVVCLGPATDEHICVTIYAVELRCGHIISCIIESVIARRSFDVHANSTNRYIACRVYL